MGITVVLVPLLEKLAVGELRPSQAVALFLCHWHAGPADLRVPAVSDSDLEASSFILDLNANFEKS